MKRYELVIEDEGGLPTVVPRAGETVEVGGSRWHVERVEDAGDCPRLHLSGRADVDASIHRAPVALAAPSSFESELVYTLNDLSTRLSTLAGALNAYWGQGAA